MVNQWFLGRMLLVGIFVVVTACDSKAPEKQTVTEEVEETIMEPVATGPNPNGDSELALFMRKMDEDLVAHKKQLKEGVFEPFTFDHTTMLIAEPTKIDNQDEQYVSYANSYLQTMEEMRNAPKDSMISLHNQWVAKCIECHNTFCNGPIVRIKKRTMTTP